VDAFVGFRDKLKPSITARVPPTEATIKMAIKTVVLVIGIFIEYGLLSGVFSHRLSNLYKLGKTIRLEY
jgi:hypothetical protein